MAPPAGAVITVTVPKLIWSPFGSVHLSVALRAGATDCRAPGGIRVCATELPGITLKTAPATAKRESDFTTKFPI
jgi:hypothetical protein